MGVCMSCLGLSRQSSNDVCHFCWHVSQLADRVFPPLQPERSHLLNSDDPYNASGYGYGSASQGLVPPRHVLNPEDVKREQEALEGIMRWTTE
jgi:hypothetical protein